MPEHLHTTYKHLGWLMCLEFGSSPWRDLDLDLDPSRGGSHLTADDALERPVVADDGDVVETLALHDAVDEGQGHVGRDADGGDLDLA